MKKDSSTNKSEKKKTKKFQPLRRQLEFLFIGLLVLSIFSITMINMLFLERYYITKKTEVLQSAMADLEGLQVVRDEEGKQTAEVSDEIRRDSSRNNLSWILITADGQEIASEGGNEGMLQARLMGYAYELDKKHVKKKILEQTDMLSLIHISEPTRPY